MESNKFFVWKFKPVTELDRGELLDVIDHLTCENKELKEDRDRWREAGDAGQYLLNKKESE